MFRECGIKFWQFCLALPFVKVEVHDIPITRSSFAIDFPVEPDDILKKALGHEHHFEVTTSQVCSAPSGFVRRGSRSDRQVSSMPGRVMLMEGVPRNTVGWQGGGCHRIVLRGVPVCGPSAGHPRRVVRRTRPASKTWTNLRPASSARFGPGWYEKESKDHRSSLCRADPRKQRPTLQGCVKVPPVVI